MATFFVQPCPTCGRNLEIRVQYLGRKVVCQHCRAEFLAQESGTASAAGPAPAQPRAGANSALLDRADQLLALFDGAQRAAGVAR